MNRGSTPKSKGKALPSKSHTAKSTRHAGLEESALLRRVFDSASQVERKLLRKFLSNCAESSLPLNEALLGAAGAPFGLTISAVDAHGHRELAHVMARGGWLRVFLLAVLGRHAERADVTVLEVSDLLNAELVGFVRQVGSAREILAKFPHVVATEIRNAAKGLPK